MAVLPLVFSRHTVQLAAAGLGYTVHRHNLNFSVGGQVFFCPTSLKKVKFVPTLSTHRYTQVFKYLILKPFVGWASVFLPTFLKNQ